MEIKEIRKILGYSQNEFAENIGIPVRTLQQWEQGRSNPPDYVKELIQNKANSCIIKNSSFLEQFKLKPVKKWNVFIEYPFKNCDKIHPLQQKKVAALLDTIKDHKAVKKAIVFGSSVTNHCHIGSDVDLYLEMTEDQNPFSCNFNFEYDFWNNYRVDSRLKQEIDKKGVVVYER